MRSLAIMPPPIDDATRPRRKDELAEQVVRQLRRLDRAISELDAGDQYALDDIVIALRSLAGGGKGNHTIAELAQITDAAPRLHPVSTPVGEDATLTFATGALPVADTHAPGAQDRSPRSLGALMKLRCLTVTPPENDQQRTYTWDQLVSAVANKLGAIHSDAEIPIAFDEIHRFETAGQPSLVHALRNLAVVVARYGHDVLTAAGFGQLLSRPNHPIPAAGRVWVGAIKVRENRRRGGSHVTFEFNSIIPSALASGRAVYPMTSVPARTGPTPPKEKLGRNQPCPCGTGMKYKRCCGR